jgi:lipoate-protein ligase A
MSSQATSWRLIIDGDLPGARNMARDMAILEAVSNGKSAPTLRLYGWDPPCLTLGRHQGLDAADLDFCRSEGIDVVRRPTGGRALLHHHELTYSIVAKPGSGPLPRGLQEAYRTICSALVRAMGDLGVDAELTSGEVNLQLPGPRSTVPCFEAPAGGEVVVRGRKLIGSAMRAHADSILQHGAIVTGWDGRLQAGSMGLDSDASLRPQITTLTDELGQEPSRATVEQALIEAVSTEFRIEFENSQPSADEAAIELKLEPSFSIAG